MGGAVTPYKFEFNPFRDLGASVQSEKPNKRCIFKYQKLTLRIGDCRLKNVIFEQISAILAAILNMQMSHILRISSDTPRSLHLPHPGTEGLRHRPGPGGGIHRS